MAPLLLGWSHAIVKMYELQTAEVQQQAAEDAAARIHLLRPEPDHRHAEHTRSPI